MRELTSLMEIANFRITAYGLLLALAVLCGILFTLYATRNAEKTLGLSIAVVLGGLVGAKVVYCLTMLETILVDMGAEFLYRWYLGGYNMYGAILGGMLGCVIYARMHKLPAAESLSCAAPGGALALAIARFAECMTDQGMGHYLDVELPFPLSVADVWGEPRLPVFFYEGIAALVIAFICLKLVRQGRHIRCAECFVFLVGITQVLLENMREDDFIRFGFVRFNQIAAAVVMAAALALSIRRMLKNGAPRSWQIVRAVLFVACIGIVIAIEFALDKTAINNVLLYAVMAAALCVMGVACLKETTKA
ncbi:MAG: prolipoprotein diacylglyceryl transferase [Clostridia bacterium]|nr:prolipoprotein diacylglyceryl transferase [Clostridia bacterium]